MSRVEKEGLQHTADQYKRADDELNEALKSKAWVALVFGGGLGLLEPLMRGLPGSFPDDGESFTSQLATLTVGLLALSLACLAISGLYQRGEARWVSEEVRRDRVARGAEVTALAASVCSVVWMLSLLGELLQLKRFPAPELLIVTFLGVFGLVLAAVAPDSFIKDEVRRLRLEEEYHRLSNESERVPYPAPWMWLSGFLALILGGGNIYHIQ